MEVDEAALDFSILVWVIADSDLERPSLRGRPFLLGGGRRHSDHPRAHGVVVLWLRFPHGWPA
jgi:hypothetical protein